jgi:hypothetical protein
MPTTIAQVEKHDVITNVDPRLGSPLRGIKIKGPHVPVIAGSALIPITDQGNRFVNRADFGPSLARPACAPRRRRGSGYGSPTLKMRAADQRHEKRPKPFEKGR